MELARHLQRVTIDADTGCWLWPGSRDNGYAVAWTPAPGRKPSGRRRQRRLPLHRLTYEAVHGEVPAVLHHVCGVRRCVNPQHLEPVTPSQHAKLHAIHDAPGLLVGQALMRDKTECPRGHSYSPENTYVTPTGHRQCRKCQREAVRRYSGRKADSAAGS